MSKYNHKIIEKKWQNFWQDNKVFKVEEDKGKEKFYGLIEFPYPSGDGLHTGHLRSNTAMDIICRKRRMQGYNVLYPIGFDSFGLPAENYAVKLDVKPQISVAKNIKVFTKQLKQSGFSFDWSRSFSTTDEDYYKWTQWIFVQMFKKGLAYKAKENINWCTKCKIGLANEEVVNGACERCGGEVVKKEKEQWMLKITEYADRLIDDLDKVDYLERIKTGQINWIGKSEGADVDFKVKDSDEVMRVFTTRPDTLFGATFMVVAPEYELISKLKDQISNYKEVEEYIKEAKQKSDWERADVAKEKIPSGIELKGIKAINPVNNSEIPIWVADYVMMGYGTGAIMAVPAHDERDFEFAKKYDLEVIEVVKPEIRNQKIETKETILLLHGILGNSQENWFSWFKDEFENRNYRVFAPDLPNSDEPKLAEWLNCLNDLKKEFEGELTIVAHSLGAITACKFIEENNLKVKKLILVAPTGKSQNSKLKMAGLIKKHINCVVEFNDTKINWQKLNGLVEKSITYFSDNDPYIPLLVQDDYKDLDCEIKIFKNKGHFNKDAGLTKFPEIISDIEGAFTDINSGKMVNSGEFDGIQPDECIKKITKWLEKNKLGKSAVNYKLHDWIFSRQRYWGEPIPMVHCEKCGWVPVPEKDLPVVLPEVEDFMPTDKGDSPLAKAKDWVNTKCPECGGLAKRETDVMPNWAGSNWYFLRYCDPKNNSALVSADKAKYWMPVDWYNGGMEHTTLHLLYSRFVYKFLYDIGAVPKECGPEPYKKRTAQGMILGRGGIKMSKSKGNVINPDDYVEKYGADTVRLYEMFIGPFDQAIAWDDRSVIGVYRFLSRVWELQEKITESIKAPARLALRGKARIAGRQKHKNTDKDLTRLVHQTIKKVSEDIENMRFNTAVSQMMILVNEMEKVEKLPITNYQLLVTLLSPFAPHICEELWSKLGHKKSIIYEKWPEYDKKLIKLEKLEIVIQINGKVRGKIFTMADEATEEGVVKEALEGVVVKKWLKGKEPKKVIYIKGKLVSIVG